MTTLERKILCDKIRSENGLTNIFAKASKQYDSEQSTHDLMSPEPGLSNDSSHNEKDESVQHDTSSYINTFHKSRRREPLKLVDNDASKHYNSSDTEEKTQVAELPKEKVGRPKMKQTDKFKTEWFQDLYVSIQDKKIGHTSLLSLKQVENLLMEKGMKLPEGYPIHEVLSALQYRLRVYRKQIMPKVGSEKELETLTLLHFKPALEALMGQQSYLQTMSAMKKIYLTFLKETKSDHGLRNLQDIWNIKLIYTKPAELREFNKWLKNRDVGFHGSDISRIRGLVSLIWERSSNPTNTRAGKHATYSPEIEDILVKFKASPYAGKEGKNIVSHTRKALNLAQISKLEGIKGPAFFDFVIQLNYEGKLTDPEISRLKPFMQWWAEEQGIALPSFFISKKKNPVYQMSPEQKNWFERHIQQLLLKNGYKISSTKSSLNLYRYLMAGLNERGVSEVRSILPSDFLIGPMIAQKLGRNLAFLKGIKAFSDAVTTHPPQMTKWTTFRGENYKEFSAKVIDAIGDLDSELFGTIALAKYKICFSKEDQTWSSFFKILKDDYYRIAGINENSREGTRAAQKKHVDSRQYEVVNEYLWNKAFGETCGNRKKGAEKDIWGNYRSDGLLRKDNSEFTADDKREFEYFTAYALQACGGLRFLSEADNVVFFEREPTKLTFETPTCIFPMKISDLYYGEISVLALYQSGERKNDLPYLVPLNTVCDAILYKYLSLKNIKDGQKLFRLGVTTLASSIKATGCRLFGPNVTFDELKNGEKANTALTCHRYRNIIVQSAQEKYKGSDARDIHAVMLGHKLSRDEGSRTTEIYGSYLTVCKRVFSTIRRIKDQMYLTDQDLEMRNLQQEMTSLKEENRQLHWKTHEGVDELLQRTDVLNDEKVLEYIISNPTFLETLRPSLLPEPDKNK